MLVVVMKSPTKIYHTNYINITERGENDAVKYMLPQCCKYTPLLLNVQVTQSTNKLKCEQTRMNFMR